MSLSVATAFEEGTPAGSGLSGAFGDGVTGPREAEIADFFIPQAPESQQIHTDPGFDAQAGYMSSDHNSALTDFGALDALGSSGLNNQSPLLSTQQSQSTATPDMQSGQMDIAMETAYVADLGQRIVNHQNQVNPSVSNKFHTNRQQDASNAVETAETAAQVKDVLVQQKQEIAAYKENAGIQGAPSAGGLMREGMASAAITTLAQTTMGPAAAAAINKAMTVASTTSALQYGFGQTQYTGERPTSRAEAKEMADVSNGQEGYHQSQQMQAAQKGPQASFANAAEMHQPQPDPEPEKLAEAEANLDHAIEGAEGMEITALERHAELAAISPDKFDLHEIDRAVRGGEAASVESEMQLNVLEHAGNSDNRLALQEHMGIDRISDLVNEQEIQAAPMPA